MVGNTLLELLLQEGTRTGAQTVTDAADEFTGPNYPGEDAYNASTSPHKGSSEGLSAAALDAEAVADRQQRETMVMDLLDNPRIK